MHPGPDLLQEVGRITIAGSRLDLQLGLLWHQLDKSTPFEVTRWKAGREQDKAVRRLAQARLENPLRDRVIAAADAADAARERRNAIVHQDWVLSGRDATRAASEILQLAPEEVPAYIESWQRESRPFPEWLRVPSRGTHVEPGPSLNVLIAVERALVQAVDEVEALSYIVASARDAGAPVGWVHPPPGADTDDGGAAPGRPASGQVRRRSARR